MDVEDKINSWKEFGIVVLCLTVALLIGCFLFGTVRPTTNVGEQGGRGVHR